MVPLYDSIELILIYGVTLMAVYYDSIRCLSIICGVGIVTEFSQKYYSGVSVQEMVERFFEWDDWTSDKTFDLMIGMTVGTALAASYATYHYWQKKNGRRSVLSYLAMSKLFYCGSFLVYCALGKYTAQNN
ncbi:hypothetical protein JTE90_023348 [Oedothorax gibbosus]|uniref:Uncharacterized protein n=1 Tax=Oedothorax gibbosus TaxID=931172 RepID=A0AAV6VGW9_9ARAC|nr:hypothetical protein JTE90_023348 [Oedothorax gibbosus]